MGEEIDQKWKNFFSFYERKKHDNVDSKENAANFKQGEISSKVETLTQTNTML